MPFATPQAQMSSIDASVDRLSRIQCAALDAAPDAMAIVDREGRFEWANPAFCALTGYSVDEVVGRNPRELLNSGCQSAAFFKDLWNTILDGRVWSGEITNRRKDGTTYVEKQTITPIVGDNGEITHFIAIKRDLTGEHRLEAQFHQAQKMELVGRLSSGIAHDFNNLLTVINATSELALMDLPADHPLRAELQTIVDTGKRAAALTRQLLSFSRNQATHSEPIDLRAVLRDFQGMLQRLIGEDIELDVDCDGGTSLIQADTGQVEQVILNLAVNARDAMPGGGRLTITVGERGRHVLLEIRDTGCGMSPETMSRIFEPFFTTKESGRGAGLGLATVYSIVSQLGGTIWPSSEFGKGTTFQIYFPVTRVDTSRQEGTRKEAVIIVEDDTALCELASRILRNHGYTVITAAAVDEALAAAAGAQLIVADRALPASVTSRCPVLYTSGFKPFTIIELLSKVRHALDRSKHALVS